jgi:retinaldehyde-binding protein 1
MSHVFDIDTSPESPELLKFAAEALNETPENREKGFRELRELLKQNPDLQYKDDEEFLTIILRCCHWYPESAIKMVSHTVLLSLPR